MMPFTVVFSLVALSQLAVAWLNAADKKAFSVAEESLERLLRNDPESAGRHLSEGLWPVQSSPITLYYEIFPDDRLVRVTDVEIVS